MVKYKPAGFCLRTICNFIDGNLLQAIFKFFNNNRNGTVLFACFNRFLNTNHFIERKSMYIFLVRIPVGKKVDGIGTVAGLTFDATFKIGITTG